jgi:cell division protein FtsI (penicillin-binding protein 3)
VKDRGERLHFLGRRILLLGVALLLSLGLFGRALDLQWRHKEFFKVQGDARHLRVMAIPAPRGRILDRHGEVLAVSTPVRSIWMTPRDLLGERHRWADLARLLDMRAADLADLVTERVSREFVYLKRHVEPALADKIVGLGLAGVHLQPEYRRYYPAGEVTAHVLGLTNVDDAGQEGTELLFDAELKGTAGSKRVIRDRLGRAVEDVERIAAPRPGGDLVLAIDGRIQNWAYRALKRSVEQHQARAGTVVVLDPLTGELLAMVNRPSYNPNSRAQRYGPHYRNRAVTDVFEPGSTIKPFTVAAALIAGQFRPDTPLDTTPGLLRVGRHVVRDLRNYGVISPATVIVKSSNVGASKLALGIPPSSLWALLSGVGFGAATGSGFPGESMGNLSHYDGWGDIHRATLSFGYGLSGTALQLARAYAVLANGGLLHRVSFVKGRETEVGSRIVPKRVANVVLRMMEGVVADGGTGHRAAVSGYRVAGKTGTVRKAAAGGYAKDRYLALFAGIAPASAPRLVVVVVIDEPRGDAYYGGEVAAPLFAEVMAGALRLLAVAPDDEALAGSEALVGTAPALRSPLLRTASARSATQ